MKKAIDAHIKKIESMGRSYERLKKNIQEYMAISRAYRDYITEHYPDAHNKAIKHITKGE